MSHLAAFARTARRQVRAIIEKQPLSDTRGRELLRRYTRIIKKTPRLIKNELGSQGGLTMYELSDTLDRVFVLYSTELEKAVAYGALENAWYRSGYKVMYSLYVEKEYRGLKLATILHLGALHVYKKLMSDTIMAPGALNAFRSLEKHGHKIKMYDIEERATVPFKWGADGIPMVEGESIERSERYALYV